jgi:hypothetical protein
MTILAWKGGSYQFETLRQHVGLEDTFINALHERTPASGSSSSTPSRASRAQRASRSTSGEHRLHLGRRSRACFLFIGCCGKSAQLPLYVWLPDAMAGPTPVSALIHAATMVTAGIYLLCRLSFLYTHFSTVMSIIALVGAFTALFAATIAVTQTELKKVLAYSTVSQLGFMFMGCGVGAFSAGFFHVFTHAFFKACLFLGAGAVMHACGDRQDIRKLGGLKKYLPKITSSPMGWRRWPSSARRSPPGFFSKDEILFRALSNPFAPTVGKIVFAMGLAAATLTAFYMCRMMIIAFDGDGPRYHGTRSRDAHGHDDHGHGHGDPNALALRARGRHEAHVVPLIPWRRSRWSRASSGCPTRGPTTRASSRPSSSPRSRTCSRPAAPRSSAPRPSDGVARHDRRLPLVDHRLRRRDLGLQAPEGRARRQAAKAARGSTAGLRQVARRRALRRRPSCASLAARPSSRRASTARRSTAWST